MAFKVNNVEAILDHKDLIIPAMNYEVEIIGAKESKSKKGDPMVVLDYEIVDTIPSGQEIDTEEYRDPIGAKLKDWITYGDYPKGHFALRGLQNFHNFFDIELTEELDAEDFIGKAGGIRVVMEPIVKSDPNGNKRPKVGGYVPL